MKKLTALLMGTAMVLSLAACGGTDDTADDPVTEPDQEPTGYTAEELAARKEAEQAAQLPTTEERLAALEAAMLDLLAAQEV